MEGRVPNAPQRSPCGLGSFDARLQLGPQNSVEAHDRPQDSDFSTNLSLISACLDNSRAASNEPWP
eukprot:9273032-Pyramimonas_sp.AAC.1